MLGAFLHDWGKANQHFQEMVYLKSEFITKSDDDKVKEFKKKLSKSWDGHAKRQMLRHEVISGILSREKPLKEWLESCQEGNLMMAIFSAIGHHLKIGADGEIADIPDGTGSDLRIYTQHEDFRRVLKMGKKYLNLPDPPETLPKEHWTRDELEQAMSYLKKECIDFSSNLNESQQRLVAAVKATVIAADLAGSALPNAEKKLEEWIEQVFQLTLSEQDLQELIDQRLRGNPLRPFQQKIADTTTRVTIVKAGCGTGKTIGAYAWGQKWAVGRKLFFCYPTTGTASQGYLDYAAETEIESRLMHSRAAIDLEELLVSHEDDGSEEIESRLEALAAWQAKLVVCTVDTVLGLMQNNRKPLFSFPAIALGAFVFDEIHSFDQALFGALLRFLKAFRGAPILLMSASLSKEQEQAICQFIHDIGEEVNIIEGEQRLEIIPRYRVEYLSEIRDAEALDEVWEIVLQTLGSSERNKKVLWVTNTVKDCITRYRQAEEKLKTLSKVVNLHIYHSRYRYKDRLERHREVIKAFQSNNPCLAITTQVCEMSLDLSADLLVSAIAPCASLIQRMGRLNRYVFEDSSGNVQLASGGTCPAIFYPWEQLHPYSKVEIATGLEFIQQLQANPAISQQDLARVSAGLSASVPKSVRSAWLDDNWCTYPIPLREGGYTMTVLMERDMLEIDRAAAERARTSNMSFPQAKMHEAQRWTVPVRLMKCRSEWKRFKFYYQVPEECIDYSEITGAEEKCN